MVFDSWKKSASVCPRAGTVSVASIGNTAPSANRATGNGCGLLSSTIAKPSTVHTAWPPCSARQSVMRSRS
jgi:hypothetical protein